MKKLVLGLVAVAALSMTSCGIDVDQAAEDFCKCKDMEAEEKDKCHDEWVDAYASKTGSDEDANKLAEKMLECDMSGMMSIAPKIEEATK